MPVDQKGPSTGAIVAGVGVILASVVGMFAATSAGKKKPAPLSGSKRRDCHCGR